MKRTLLLALLVACSPFAYSSPFRAPADDADVYVLSYHSFVGRNFQQDFAPEVFKKQVESIRDLGYRFVSFQDIAEGRVTGKTNILVTIDDGNASIRKIFDPVLKANGIKPLLFIYPAITDRMRYSLTFVDLKYFISQGATVGAHGYYHMFVNEKFYNKNRNGFMKEIYQSKERLETKLDVPVDIFCYPFGVFSEITVETLKQAGYSCAFTLKSGVMKAPLDRNADLFRLPRFYVTKSSWNGIYRMLRENIQGNRHAKDPGVKNTQGM